MNVDILTQKTETRVLVVDDDEVNRLLLTAPLERLEYTVREAENGRVALDVVREWAPDIILLDVMMPEVDGLEVCRKLKQDPETCIIPIIMVTALDESELRIKAIENGADDFLTKPIDLHEVLLRVSNSVRTKKLYDELQVSYEELKRSQLLKAELTGMIVHDIRSPLHVVQGYMDLLEMECAGKMGEEQKRWFNIARNGVGGIDQLSMTLLTLQSMEAGEFSVDAGPVNVLPLCEEIMDSFRVLYADRQLEFQVDAAGAVAEAEPELLTRILHNLISNARKFTRSKDLIRLRLSSDEHWVVLECEDSGQGIPAERLELIFDKFTQGDDKHKRMGIGLGLAFCKMASEAMGGSIEAKSVEGEGTTFLVRLPRSVEG